ncbi:MAG TPA: hypothetical protein VKR56_10125, partial [Candidatus Cybelea sp.]|nr:hypothetical protein [Candidatus Cybelea sp.]
AAVRRSTDAVAGTIVEPEPRPGADGAEFPALQAATKALRSAKSAGDDFLPSQLTVAPRPAPAIVWERRQMR